MKKIGKLRKFGLALVTLFLCVAMLATYFTFAGTIFDVVIARAEESGDVFTSNGALIEDVTVPTSCKYGESFKVEAPASGTDVKVSAPDGTEVALGDPAEGKYSVKALQLGNYTVTYYRTDGEPEDETVTASYSYNVYVSLDEDYFLKVDYNGADIMTYMTADDSFKLPGARVVYYDEDNILKNYKGDVALTITDSYGKTYNVGDDFKPKTAEHTYQGKVYLTYAAAVGGGKKYFSQTFEVNIQANVNDTSRPVLTVSGVQSTVSVNRPVTLPTATATDNFDENIKIEIVVTDDNGDRVRLVDVDRYGNAYRVDADLNADTTAGFPGTDGYSSTWNYPYVDFDNDQAMTFYPTETGTYKVSYTATDDAGNSSVTKSFTLTCTDSVAPVFQDIADWQIPSTWGIDVKNKEGSPAVSLAGKINVPIPTLSDNADSMDEGISLYVRITDSDYSRVIVEFKNVLSETTEGEDGKVTGDCVFTGNDYYPAEDPIVFNADNEFVFDVTHYERKDNSGSPVTDKTGKYTIYYRAEDSSGNRSSKTYTVEFEQNFTDENEPSTAEVEVTPYISAADEMLNIPTPQVADSKDTRLHTVYRIYTDAEDVDDEEGGRYITVKGGEAAEIVEKADGLYLVINKGKTDKYDDIDGYAKLEKSLKLGNKLYFCVAATDAANNAKLNLKSGSAHAEDTEYTEDNYQDCEAVVTVIGTAAAPTYRDGLGNDIKVEKREGKESDWVDPDDVHDEDKIYTDDHVRIGGFYIETTTDMRKYTGFEVKVTDKNGSVYDTTLDTFTEFDEADAKIYVGNISFTPTVAGKYDIAVRVFDVNNNNSVYTYSLNVEQTSVGSGSTKDSATVITAGGNYDINVKYTLPNDKIEGLPEDPNGTYYVARQITGPTYSLMGSELVAKAQGSYSVTTGYIDENDVDGANTDFADVKPWGANGGKISFNVVDTEAPVIEIQGVMPSYSKKYLEKTEDNRDTYDEDTYTDVPVTLPSIVAYAKNGNAVVKVTIKHVKSGSNYTEKGLVDYDEVTNRYSFKPTADGAYEVTITATRADEEVTATYTINVGDVFGPEFDVEGGTRGRVQQGKEFTFGTMKLKEEESNVTITKTLIDPKREEVSSAKVSGSYTSYREAPNANSTITLDKSGTYEVVYTAEDSNGNKTTYRYVVTVTAKGSGSATTFTKLSIALIVIAVVLLAGVIVYVVRFRKVKK